MMHFNYMLLAFGLLIFGFQEASSQDICQLPKDVGRCKASFPRFYFDTAKGNCEPFNYGGCEGNKNNFKTLDKCRAACQHSGVYPTKCTLTPTVGLCNRHLPRYFFSTGMKTCMMFVYTGCGGNDNNFKSLNQCIRECQSHDETPDICNLPAKVGRCKASFERFYFNTTTGHCEKFTYGGCNGNKNNFVYWSQCRATCLNNVPFPEKCTLRPKTGPCDTPTIRYFFDTITGTCMMFVYSGCWGNENNFMSEEICLNECRNTGQQIPVLYRIDRWGGFSS